jgi:hypothetical protein
MLDWLVLEHMTCRILDFNFYGFLNSFSSKTCEMQESTKTTKNIKL